MGILQQASGAFTGTTFTATLPGPSSASNRVVVIVAGNTTVTTLAGFTLRTSQVNQMGHYLFDSAGGSTSYVWTTASGQGTWYIAEIQAGAYQNALSQNDTTGSTSYLTPTLTPTAGEKVLIASLGSLTSGAAVRTMSGWTSSFIEQADVCQATVDYPMQGVATLDLIADGTTGYTTTGTYSLTSTGRSAIIGSYTTTSGAVVQPEGRRSILRHAGRGPRLGAGMFRVRRGDTSQYFPIAYSADATVATTATIAATASTAMSADSTLAITAAIATQATRNTRADATIATTASIVADALLNHVADVTVATTATIVVDSQVSRFAVCTVATTATIAVQATRNTLADVTVATTATVVAAAAQGMSAAVAVATTATIVVAATVTSAANYNADVTVATTATIATSAWNAMHADAAVSITFGVIADTRRSQLVDAAVLAITATIVVDATIDFTVDSPQFDILNDTLPQLQYGPTGKVPSIKDMRRALTVSAVSASYPVNRLNGMSKNDLMFACRQHHILTVELGTDA